MIFTRGFILSLFGLFVSFSGGADEAPAAGDSKKSHVRYYPAQVLPNEVVQFRPTQGFNINLDAPNDCGGAKKIKIDKKAVRCQFVENSKYAPNIYVCDDGKKACYIEKTQVVLRGKKGPGFFANLLSFMSKPKPKPQYAGFTRKSPNKKIKGFIQNNVEAAKRLARAQKKNILIFSTQQYCPPCMLVKEYTISNPEFYDVAQNYVLLQLDSEIDEFNEVKEPWGLLYTPTFVIVDPDMKEIAKRVGFLSLPSFKRWVSWVQSFNSEPIATVEKRLLDGKASSKDILRLATNQYYGYHFDKSIENFKKLKDPQQKTLEKIDFIKFRKASGLQALTLASEFDKKYPHDPRTHYGLWGLEKLKLGESSQIAKVKKTMISLIGRKKKLLKAQPKDIENRLNLVYLQQIYSKLLWQWGDKEQARSVTDGAIADMKAMAISESQKNSEGMRVYLAALNNNIGDSDKATEIHKKSVTEDPDNFSFEYLNAIYLAESKNYDQALAELKKSEKKAKGKQWIQVKKLQIDLLIKSKRYKEAKAEVERQLSVVNLPESDSARVHSFVSALRDFQGQLKEKI